MSLKRKAFNSGKWTSISMIVVTLLQLSQLAVLTRFLAPEDFGLMAIITVFIAFSAAFQDMGISNAIIQRQDITHIQLSSLYWLNIVAGIVLFFVVAALAPFVAWFYNEPQITQLMLLVALTFPINAVGNQYRVLCQKYFNFKTMESINMLTACLGFIVAVSLAINDFGVITLVLASLVSVTAASVMFLFVGLRNYHKPTFTYQHQELRHFYSFGMYQMGEKILNNLQEQFDKLLLGKFVGTAGTGFYNMAWTLIIFPVSRINPIVNKVAFPLYATQQNNPQALNKYYSFNIKFLTLVTFPILAYLFWFADEAVVFIYGEGWDETAKLIPVLALIGMGKALGNPGGAILTGLGKVKVEFWWNFYWSLVLVVGLTISLYISPTSQTMAYSLLGLSLTFGNGWHYLIAKYGGVNYWPVLKHTFKIIAVVMIIGFAGRYFANSLFADKNFLLLLSGGLLCLSLYLLYLILFERSLLYQLKGA